MEPGRFPRLAVSSLVKTEGFHGSCKGNQRYQRMVSFTQVFFVENVKLELSWYVFLGMTHEMTWKHPVILTNHIHELLFSWRTKGNQPVQSVSVAVSLLLQDLNQVGG